MNSITYNESHEAVRASLAHFIDREVRPHFERWDESGLIDRSFWTAAGTAGLIGLSVPESYGGAGVRDYRFRTVMMEEFTRAGYAAIASGLNTHEDIVLPYFLDLATEQQKKRWLPGLASGRLISAIAMTEPDTGSDLQGIRTVARRDGDDWILSGQKTFITNGILSDVIVVAARTDPAAGSKGLSLFVVEAGMAGFTRGRKLKKIGLHAQDTAELYFEGVRLPASNLLGVEGQGFRHLMERLPRERISIAAFGLSSARAAFEWTHEYCFTRRAFKTRIGDFQNTRFALAEMSTELDVATAYMDWAIGALNAETLSAVDAAKAKWWVTELQTRLIDRCVQLHGGYGYMAEYPIARAYVDSRAQTIYGGTTEIMKEIIGRDLAPRP